MEEAKTTEKSHQILVVGKHEYVLEKLDGLLRESGFQTSTCIADEEVLKVLQKESPDLLVIGGGIEPRHKLAYFEFIQSQMPDVRVVEHFGGPATLIPEVSSVLGISA